MDFPKHYDANREEKNGQFYWEDRELYRFREDHPGSYYTVDTSPPTVSGEIWTGEPAAYNNLLDMCRKTSKMSLYLFFEGRSKLM